MFLPVQLYRLTERDLGDQWGRLYAPPQASNGAAAATVTASIVLPGGGPILFSNCSAIFLPGAAQTLLFGEVSYTLLTGGNVTFSFEAPHPLPAAAQRIAHNWRGSMLIPARSVLNVTGTFNAGVAVNSVTFSINGFQIPLGTLLVS